MGSAHRPGDQSLRSFGPQAQRVLLTGWYSFRHGEATAGDVLAGEAVAAALRSRGIAYDTAWSPNFRPAGLHLHHADPARYSHVVFACGPLHSRPPAPGVPPPLAELHERFAACRRIAVGVSTPDPADPAVAGFHLVLPRDAPDCAPLPDLALLAPRPAPVPVVAVVLTDGQHEYGPRRRHTDVSHALTRWLRALDVTRLPVDTRLDAHDWRLCSTPAQLRTLLSRVDAVVTTRLHGLVLGLEAGAPVLAVDPVAGGAKVTAQARALDWPAVLPAEQADDAHLAEWWAWCLTPQARHRAGRLRADGLARPDILDRLLTELRPLGGRHPSR
ncbi:polysaccharide pyruvyl transferase family protein [Kitasatospora sp. NPDC018619]|uniref:polysaccharide pyruvyl transferase family protein n=1 Tax=unclassified Kitasatospora TaxID=2633591 RepID=UPI0037B0F750